MPNQQYDMAAVEDQLVAALKARSQVTGAPYRNGTSRKKRDPRMAASVAAQAQLPAGRGQRLLPAGAGVVQGQLPGGRQRLMLPAGTGGGGGVDATSMIDDVLGMAGMGAAGHAGGGADVAGEASKLAAGAPEASLWSKGLSVAGKYAMPALGLLAIYQLASGLYGATAGAEKNRRLEMVQNAFGPGFDTAQTGADLAGQTELARSTMASERAHGLGEIQQRLGDAEQERLLRQDLANRQSDIESVALSQPPSIEERIAYARGVFHSAIADAHGAF